MVYNSGVTFWFFSGVNNCPPHPITLVCYLIITFHYPVRDCNTLLSTVSPTGWWLRLLLFVCLFWELSCSPHPSDPIWAGHLAGWWHSFPPGISVYFSSLLDSLCPGSHACHFLGLFPCFLGADSSFWDQTGAGNFEVLLFREGILYSSSPSITLIKHCGGPAWVKGNGVVFSARGECYLPLQAQLLRPRRNILCSCAIPSKSWDCR